jgi:hypothetical protein
MSRLARTERLADLYDEASAELDEVVRLMESGDKAAALVGMQRVATVMDKIGATLADGPIWSDPAADPGALSSLQARQAGRSSAAERQRRRWGRIRRGEAVAPVTFNAPILDTLIALRWLAEHDATDRAKVGDAIGRMLADLAQHRLK